MSFPAAALPGVGVFVVTSVVQQLHGRLRVVVEKEEGYWSADAENCWLPTGRGGACDCAGWGGAPDGGARTP